MIGWKARRGFLVLSGKPTVEPEMMQLVPPGASLHFWRLAATGPTGTTEGFDTLEKAAETEGLIA